MSQLSQAGNVSKAESSPGPRIAILVLGCLLPVYERCINSIRATWGAKARPAVDIYYVYGAQGVNDNPELVRIEDLIGQDCPVLKDYEVWASGDIILSGAADIYADQPDCILRKRLIAFGYLANRKRYDFVYAVCASSYVDVDVLQQYVRPLSASGNYQGPLLVSKASGYPFVSGASILMSADVVASLSKHSESIVARNGGAYPDDVAIGRWIAENYCAESTSEISRRIDAGEKATDNQTFVLPYGRGMVDYVEAPVTTQVPRKNTFHYHFNSRRMWQMEEFHRRYFSGAVHYSLAENVQAQDLGLGGDSVLVDVESGEIYTCNSSATKILKHLTSGLRLNDATDQIMNNYDIDRATLETEIRKLVDELMGKNLIVGAHA